MAKFDVLVSVVTFAAVDADNADEAKATIEKAIQDGGGVSVDLGFDNQFRDGTLQHCNADPEGSARSALGKLTQEQRNAVKDAMQ